MSWVQYHRPLPFLRSQARGTSTSKITTTSARPPCRWMASSVAPKDLAGPCGQTTGQRPRLWPPSQPRRSMPGRLRRRVARRRRRGPIPSRPGRPGRRAMSRPVSVDDLKGALVDCSGFVDEGRDPLPIRWPPAAHRTGPEVRSSITPFAASEGQQCGGNDPEETPREVCSSLQAFKRPTVRQGGQRRSGDGGEARPIQGRRQAMSPADRRRFANLARGPTARPRPVRSRPRARTPPRPCGSTAPPIGRGPSTSRGNMRGGCGKPVPRSNFWS
jgi:hypothetical protein